MVQGTTDDADWVHELSVPGVSGDHTLAGRCRGNKFQQKTADTTLCAPQQHGPCAKATCYDLTAGINTDSALIAVDKGQLPCLFRLYNQEKECTMIVYTPVT